jgi:hypothetical protein
MPGNLQIYDSVTGQTANVNSSREVMVSLSPANPGPVWISDTEGDPLEATESGALRVSSDALSFVEQVDGNTLNPVKWSTSASGMTIAQAGGFITLNSGNATTANAYAILQSLQYFPFFGPMPTRVLMRTLTPIQPQLNVTQEAGIGLVATNAAPTDGAFFRWNSSAQFVAVVSNGGVETTALLTAPASNTAALLEITIVEDAVQFNVNDTLAAEIMVPAGQAFPTNNGRLPLFQRVYCGAAPPVQAPSLNLGQCVVVQQDMEKNRSWAETMAGLGLGSYQAPTAYTQSANHANSTGPVSATLSNTAAGYTTLGGRYQFAAVAGGVTDYALFAFQVPSGYRLWVNSIAISAMVTGLAVVTPTVLDWSLGLNSSAVSLATTDGASTWAPRRIPLGMQGFLALAAIGQTAPDVSRRFDTPLVVESGRYLHVILAVPNGAATASLVLRGDVMINGYFE